MIISRRYRYLFVEIPLTASWAIRNELCRFYDGRPILHKHAAYPEFRRIAQEHEREYFVFATVRNPLDQAVSRYFKLKTDHKGTFSDPEAIERLEADYSDVEKHQFVEKPGITFADYFRRYHCRPFNSILNLSAGALDFVMRYESLQDDFAAVLKRLGSEQIRPVPVINRTEGRQRDWQQYYTAEIIEQAMRKFGPFMKKWDYELPVGWGETKPNWRDALEFRALGGAQSLYWQHIRYNDGFSGRMIRRLRAKLIR